ncbi:Repeat domain-containing protein [Sinosporangium album]|uniref:Repeat domain-containing protein n=1 Tax=Sinosporangium album TaxID=504805 RepID=A0A1G8GBD9_9ACTN|nr:GDSL-type esterase/lipase family protein [Sinosporangium album]SDH91685.1 Repeat domain-containing protein [Sinosporangium album]
MRFLRKHARKGARGTSPPPSAGPRPVRRALRRLRVAALALTALAGTLTAVGQNAPAAHAARLDQTSVITNNMEGSNVRAPIGAKWTNRIAWYASRADVVMLQEAGPGLPPSAARAPNIVWDATRPGQAGYVQHGTWQPLGDRIDYHVYFLQTDTAGGTHIGGRVNSAIVTRWEPDEVAVLRNPHPGGGRPALGLLFGDTWYFTFHAYPGDQQGNGAGRDAAMMVRDIAAWASNVRGGEHYVIGADFNMEPENLRAAADMPATARIYRSGQATHWQGLELDYFVSDLPRAPGRVEALPGPGDHLGVGIGPWTRTSRPPPQPSPSQHVSVTPVGDGPTWGGIGVDHGNGFRHGFLHAIGDYQVREPRSLRPRPGDPPDRLMRLFTSVDFAGTQRSGTMTDPDHEGYPDHEIDQIADKLRASLPPLNPNVVTLMAGTTDMKNNTDVAGAPARLRRLIDQILEDVPGVTVLVATLIPAADPAVQARINAFNEQLPALVNQMQEEGKHVELVWMRHVTTADLSDGLHPNQAGYQKMAEAFTDGVIGAWLHNWLSTGSDTVAQTIRAMALGSSTTYGEGSSHGNGYRAVADKGFSDLANRNAEQAGGSGGPPAAVMGADDTSPRVDWVGSLLVGRMADRETEGWRGFRINEIAGKAKCAVTTYQPNLITLLAGGNDVIQNYQMDGAIGRLEALIEQVSADAPGVTVLVAGIQPLRNPDEDARGKAFTAQIPAMVNRLVARGLRVEYADTTGMGLSDLGPDPIHPNDQGYEKIGNAFVRAAEQANGKSWIRTANPQAPNAGSHPCGIKDEGPGLPVPTPFNLGPNWQDRGVIQSQQFPSSSRFWMVDINKDRKAEFVAVDKDQKFRFWWNGGPSGANWVPFVEGQNSYTPAPGAVGNMLRFGDMDGDGFPDCMVVHLDGRVNLFTWNADNPSGSRMCKQEVGVPPADVRSRGDEGDRLVINPSTKIRFADVTGGGRTDYLLIQPDGTTTAWYNQGLQFQGPTMRYWKWDLPKRISGPLVLPREIRYADINGDRRADRILITAKGGARAWINEGATGAGGTYRDIGRIADDSGLPPKDIQFADLDGDGKDDLVRIGWTGVTRAFLNKLPANYFDTFHP